MLDKTNLSTDEEVYSLISIQSAKVVFLQETIKLIKQDAPIPVQLETGLVNHGYLDLLDQIKVSSRAVIVNLLEKQLLIEKEALKELTRF